MTQTLAGKVALVTGGSRGIGAATARILAAQGATVALSYASSPERAQAVVDEIAAAGGTASAFQADQADAGAVAALVQAIHARFGRLDILIANAGIYVQGSPDDPATDWAEIDRQWAVNVQGVIAAIRAAWPLLSEDGRIVSVGSALGSRVPFPGIADYAATKAALAGYTRAVARDLALRRITVNLVQPGSVNTEMNPADSAYADYQTAQNVLGRYGRPEEIAAGIAFLASPAASFITGATLNIDGGFTS